MLGWLVTKRLSLLLVVLTLGCHKSVLDEASEQSVTALIGKWTVLSTNSGAGEQNGNGAVLAITRNELALLSASGQRLKMGDIGRVDSSKIPNEIDLHHAGDIGMGIYQLNGDE